MTEIEFIEKIRNGSDILFDVAGRHYVIFTWMDGGIGIGEQHRDDPIQYFDTPEILIHNFKVGGTPLAQLCNMITITEYT